MAHWYRISAGDLGGTMPSKNRRIESSHLWISAWTIAWVTVTPLFHVHLPDLSDRPDSRCSGPPTVFSADLPGKFSRFADAKPQDQLELDFVLSEELKDDKARHLCILGDLESLLVKPLPPISAMESCARHRQDLVFAIPQGPRAPPCDVSL